ncbi:MAG: PHP domain-containing protein, partial [Candidatus Hydrogenedentota bacterium]
GTNKEAIIAGADILAHPGHITLEEIKMTIDNNVYLEITARKGHSLFNGYLYKYFQKYNFPVICSSDAHSADDLLTEEMYRKVLIGAGFDKSECNIIEKNARGLLRRCLRRI